MKCTSLILLGACQLSSISLLSTSPAVPDHCCCKSWSLLYNNTLCPLASPVSTAWTLPRDSQWLSPIGKPSKPEAGPRYSPAQPPVAGALRAPPKPRGRPWAAPTCASLGDARSAELALPTAGQTGVPGVSALRASPIRGGAGAVWRAG